MSFFPRYNPHATPVGVRRKVFVSYHHADEREVAAFVRLFDHQGDSFIVRGIGEEMPGDVIDSGDPDYVMRRVRELYIQDSTVTMVLIGDSTWTRRYVDWEIQASLRWGDGGAPNGLLGIRLPRPYGVTYPDRLNLNLCGPNAVDCYARVYSVPSTTCEMRSHIEDAFRARTDRAHMIVNPPQRLLRNSRES